MSLWDQFVPDQVKYYPFEEEQPGIYWVMRSPSFADERNMAVWQNEKPRTSPEIEGKELASTLVETTFPAHDSPVKDDPDDPNYQFAFGSEFREDEVIKYLDQLPAAVVNEMWNFMKDKVAPHWGPRFPQPTRPRGPIDSGPGK